MIPNDQAPLLTEGEVRQLHCYTCGNDNAYELQEVEEAVVVGHNTVIVPIRAGVCQYCGERVLDLPTIHRLDDVRRRMQRGETIDFTQVGITYRAS